MIVTQNINIKLNNYLTVISFQKLITVTGDLTIVSNPILNTITNDGWKFDKCIYDIFIF